MRTHRDVIIAGASIAGLSAAYHAAKEGADVLVVDQKTDLGEFKCAEGILDMHLSAVGIPELDDWVDVRFQKVSLFPPNGKELEIRAKYHHGLIINRRRFQLWLAARAQKAGAEVLIGKRVSEAYPHEGVLVTTSSGGDQYWSADSFIDATGIHAWLGRTMDPSLESIDREEFGPVFQRTIETDELHQFDDRIALWFGEKNGIPGGYAWIFPKGDSTYNVGLGGISSMIKGQNLQHLLNRFMLRHVADWEELYHVGSRLPLARPLKRYAFTGASGTNLLLTGDAARLCWPLTGAGIFTALYSGKIAGENWDDPDFFDATIKARFSRRQKNAYELLLKHRTDKGMTSMFRWLRFALWFHRLAPRWFEERAFAGSWRLT